MGINFVKFMWCIIALTLITHMLLIYQKVSESQSPNYIFSQEAKRYFEATTPIEATTPKSDIKTKEDPTSNIIETKGSIYDGSLLFKRSNESKEYVTNLKKSHVDSQEPKPSQTDNPSKEDPTPKSHSKEESDIASRLKKLKSLKDQGLISEDEFKQKKAEYLKGI